MNMKFDICEVHAIKLTVIVRQTDLSKSPEGHKMAEHGTHIYPKKNLAQFNDKDHLHRAGPVYSRWC